jgi:hypothetical protein
MFKTESQFQCIGLDPTKNEGIREITRDWTHFKVRKLGIRPGYYDRLGIAKLLLKHKASPDVIQYIAQTMTA